MSKERELLKRWFNDIGIIQADIKLLRDTQKLLAKPEQTEQEPVAWMWANEELGGFYFSNIENPNWKPLYTAPPKREPLSESEIREGNESMFNVIRESFIKGVRFAEVMHGIGGG